MSTWVAAFVAAAEQSKANPNGEEAAQDALQIGMAPDEALRRNTDLFRKAADGDERAMNSWRELKVVDRAAALDRVLGFSAATLRAKAVKELTAFSAEDATANRVAQALVKAALSDKDDEVRAAAHAALAACPGDQSAKLLAKQLLAREPEKRERALQALKVMGGARVYEAIVEHWREIWGPGPRAHCFYGRQRAYVSDYDISGDAYDPVIRQVLTGAVLDVKPLLLYADYFMVRALREVTGMEAGQDRAAWEKWLEADRRKRKAGEQEQLFVERVIEK